MCGLLTTHHPALLPQGNCHWLAIATAPVVLFFPQGGGWPARQGHLRAGPSAAVQKEVPDINSRGVLGTCYLRNSLFSYYCYSTDFPFGIFPFGFQLHSFSSSLQQLTPCSSQLLIFVPEPPNVSCHAPESVTCIGLGFLQPRSPIDGAAGIRLHLFLRVFIFAILLVSFMPSLRTS